MKIKKISINFTLTEFSPIFTDIFNDCEIF